MKMKRRYIAGILAAALLLCGCGQEDTKEPVSIQVFAMDTYMTLTAYGKHAEKAVERAQQEILRIDRLVSTGDPDSEISKLNASKGETVSEDTFYLIERAKEITRDTDGAFDISVYPIMRAWGFTDGRYRVPEEKELKRLLEHVHADQILCEGDTHKVILTDPKMEIDLGGIAKGYTSDRVIEILQENGVEHALINLGGNVKTLGHRPDGSDWNIAVTDPEDTQTFIGGVRTSDKAVITSGGYQRYFEKDGVIYDHIIDVSTGYPADSGLSSVTVIAEDGTLADGVSTSLFIMGLEKAGEHWRDNAKMFDAVFVEDDGSIWITEGIKDHFSSEKEYQVIQRDL